jgi:hypothetical protein
MNPPAPGEIERGAKRAEIQARVNASRLDDAIRNRRMPVEITDDKIVGEYGKYGWIQENVVVDGMVGVGVPLVAPKDKFRMENILIDKTREITSNSLAYLV